MRRKALIMFNKIKVLSGGGRGIRTLGLMAASQN